MRIRKISKWQAIPIVLAIVAAVVVTALRATIRHLYPYGASHSCDVGLMFALDQYARENDGKYPAGEDSPEASLSLLYPKYTDASTLCGKIVPLEVTQARLESGKLLTPETGGWNYVEGLTLSDDKSLALVWDKARLGHNGELTSDGGTKVLFVDMGHVYVTGSDWDAFVTEQSKYHATWNSDLSLSRTLTEGASGFALQADASESE